MRLTGINRFPVKSCRGEALDSATVEPWGLAGDRRWMLVDDGGYVITARECNPMVLLRPFLTDEGLRIEAPGLPPLEVRRPDGSQLGRVRIWDSELDAAPAAAEADAWFSRAMGRSAHLVYLDDPRRRTTEPEFGERSDRVSFADGYPLLLATEESLAALNDVVVERSTPVEMIRFRPSVVVAGSPAWAEDDWRQIRIGDAVFRLVKGCARCVLTTIDPVTAERGKEPIASLARIRRFDGQTWFGMNLVPAMTDLPGTTITLGDQVEVLESVPPGAGPIRPRRSGGGR